MVEQQLVRPLYKIVVSLKDKGWAATKKEAVQLIWEAVKEGLENKTIKTYQELDTTCWIEEGPRPLFTFHEARDYAYAQGWAKDGEWIA